MSAASGDALMIAAARSCFSAYRFDGEAALFACGLCHSLGGGLERRLFILSRADIFLNMRVSFALVLVIAFPLLANAHIISLVWRLVRSLRRIASAVDTFRASVFRPHHLIISCGGAVSFSSSSGAASVSPGVLSSHRGRLSCGGRLALSLISPCVSF